MSHDHEHAGDTYYLDQLCLIALSGAFGGVCLTLYVVKNDMLSLMLGPQFHPFVLWSGIVLLTLAAVRAAVIWRQAGLEKHSSAKHAEHTHDSEHDCGHDHDHGECSHSHGHGHHEHGHGHEHQHEHSHGHGDDHGHVHSHGHSHEHSHEHSHDHGNDCCADHNHADHDHGWAPWRYVVLLLPVFLFLLGLPNEPPKLRAINMNLDLTIDQPRAMAGYSTLVAACSDPWSAAASPNLWRYTVATAALHPPVIGLDFKTLEAVARDQEVRRKAGVESGTWVRVRGQFLPDRFSENIFQLVRLRIQCCAADAVQLNVPMICNEKLTGMKSDSWIEVTGRLEFREKAGKTFTVVHVPSRRAITPTAPDANPWIN